MRKIFGKFHGEQVGKRLMKKRKKSKISKEMIKNEKT